jgi:hypothetical protein
MEHVSVHQKYMTGGYQETGREQGPSHQTYQPLHEKDTKTARIKNQEQ